jgi:hypothetical protein
MKYRAVIRSQAEIIEKLEAALAEAIKAKDQE